MKLFELYPFEVYTKEILDGMEEETRAIYVNCSIAKQTHFAEEINHLYFQNEA